jgi:23S rRNA pseudouridine1911/1915/1917 synthase
MVEKFPRKVTITAEDAGLRLDQFLAGQLGDVSRARVQQLLQEGKVTVNDKLAKPSLRLKGTEAISVLGPVELPPLKAFAEDIPLDVVYEDADLAVVNKPSGMVVHASAGSSDDPRNRGTLVNALLHRMKRLSKGSDELRPGIVHRLDKDTSGLIIVAKNDRAHRKLSEQFSKRTIDKRYLALVHGWPKQESGTVNAPIGRDRSNRARMSTRGDDARDAVSHYKVLEKIDSRYGKFSLIEVKIDTGRTHQIRVHMASLGHAVVGDTLYGASSAISPLTRTRQRFGHSVSTKAEAKKSALRKKKGGESSTLELSRNFLHSASVRFTHPKSGKELEFSALLPAELDKYLAALRDEG